MTMENNWIKTKAIFAGDYAELGLDEYVEEDFVFNPRIVIAYNRSSHPDKTCIWFANTSITVDIPFEEMEGLLGNHVGK